MSTQSFDIVKDSIAGDISVVAGVNATFRVAGDTIPSGLVLADTTVTDTRIQPVVALKTRKSQYDKGEFSNYKRFFTHSIPRLRASGLYTFDVVRIEISISPETAVVDAVAQELSCAQLLFNATLSDFRRSGALS